jgi:tetratricopeptide (TPR) repeat protein
MNPTHDTTVPMPVLSLSEMLTKYVSGQTQRIEEGGLPVDLGGEIELHDASSGQSIDPRMAWDEAVAALKAAGQKPSLPSPGNVPEWRALVAAQEPALDLAFAAGNFPQMVRNLNLLLQGGEAPKTPPFPSASLTSWAEKMTGKSAPQSLLAVGMLRLAQNFKKAFQLLNDVSKNVPGEWKAACQNEEAALAWHEGRREEAAKLWEKVDAAYLPGQFNRGMAALFLGKPADAIGPLKKVIAQLPESASWHHLARLYLTLAEMRQS